MHDACMPAPPAAPAQETLPFPGNAKFNQNSLGWIQKVLLHRMMSDDDDAELWSLCD